MAFPTRARTVASSTRVCTVTVAVGVALLATPVFAQSRPGFAVNRYEPSERGGGWFVVDALDLQGSASARSALGVTLDYAHKPLVVYDAAQNERVALVRDQLFAHLGAAVVVAERLRFGVNVPIAVHQDGEAAVVRGEALSGATAPAFGDVRLAADVRVFGEHDAPLRLALGVRSWLPTGLRSQFTSDGSARISPQALVAGDAGIFVWAARFAVVVRPRDDTYAGAPLGTELGGSVGVGVRVGRLVVGPEVFAATRVDGDAFLTKQGTPADAVLGARYALASGLRFALALGSGLTRGHGSPAFRALASIEWGQPIDPPDRDHDGMLDASDACPDMPGVASGDPELNGCPERIDERTPDEDTDGDAVWDRDDACPTTKGPRSPDPMRNGCPPEAPRRLAIVTSTEIRIGEQIQFATESADLVSESDTILTAVKRLLDEHPDLARLRVEGHTDDTGNASYNDDLSRRRAASVARWLVEHGVAQSRLVSEGFGSTRPIDSNATDEGRSKNRRVVFTILERRPRP